MPSLESEAHPIRRYVLHGRPCHVVSSVWSSVAIAASLVGKDLQTHGELTRLVTDQSIYVTTPNRHQAHWFGGEKNKMLFKVMFDLHYVYISSTLLILYTDCRSYSH